MARPKGKSVGVPHLKNNNGTTHKLAPKMAPKKTPTISLAYDTKNQPPTAPRDDL